MKKNKKEQNKKQKQRLFKINALEGKLRNARRKIVCYVQRINKDRIP
jgi:hypothetical protein